MIEVTLFTTVSTATATGTGTSETSSDISVPSAGKFLCSVAGLVTADGGSVSESLCGKFSLEGVDNKNTPLEWISENGYSYLGTANSQGQETFPKWKNFFQYFTPNSTISIKYTPFDGISDNAKSRVWFLWSDVPITSKLPRNSKVSSTFSSVDGSSTDLTISSMSRLLEVKSTLCLAQPTVNESYISTQKIVSSSLLGVQQIEIPLYSTTIEATGATVATPQPDVQLDIPISPNKSNSCSFQISNSVTASTTVAGIIATEITYLPTSIAK